MNNLYFYLMYVMIVVIILFLQEYFSSKLGYIMFGPNIVSGSLVLALVISHYIINIVLKNFSLIWLWMFVKKYYPQSILMEFFKKLQCSKLFQCVILILSLLVDIFVVFFYIKEYYQDIFFLIIMCHVIISMYCGIFIVFLILIIFLKNDLWKSRQAAKKS